MNEFSHLVAHDAIGRTGTIRLSASETERRAVAMRLDLGALDSLVVTAEIESLTDGARLTGTVAAKLVQNCAATGLPLTATIQAPFDLRYLSDQPAPDAADVDGEIELGDADCDIMPLEPGGIDVGEAAVQSLALALDPFPRHPDADRILAEKGVLSEGQAGPFAALAALKRS